ncbi:hypothetical protein OGAPHI_000743 [Ogataea philodendri]|uniref:Uncharacterized protein n=1 Tax=Ogataea philodendri TaxID=1378263 RepID=A0A9P8PFR4_9ASCO|nr:uncharacterized protein OGAPHI_000743 [Ogataea philodendri]KAH3671032.1 hypothetical protein OGAPHI_000743 [Ogataea philodendri]
MDFRKPVAEQIADNHCSRATSSEYYSLESTERSLRIESWTGICTRTDRAPTTHLQLGQSWTAPAQEEVPPGTVVATDKTQPVEHSNQPCCSLQNRTWSAGGGTVVAEQRSSAHMAESEAGRKHGADDIEEEPPQRTVEDNFFPMQTS